MGFQHSNSDMPWLMGFRGLVYGEGFRVYGV